MATSAGSAPEAAICHEEWATARQYRSFPDGV